MRYEHIALGTGLKLLALEVVEIPSNSFSVQMKIRRIDRSTRCQQCTNRTLRRLHFFILGNRNITVPASNDSSPRITFSAFFRAQSATSRSNAVRAQSR